MTVHRIVPDLAVTGPSGRTHPSATARLGAATAFYTDVLGMQVAMDLGWIVTLADPDDPRAQLSLMTHDATAPVVPTVSIEVADVDAAHAACLARGDEIVHPLTDEEWGVRRFFVRDPSGAVVNVLQHRSAPVSG